MARLVPSTLATLFACSVALGGCLAEVDSPDSPDPMSERANLNTEATAFNYFVSKGLTETQSAAIVGNLIQESNVSPTAIQGGGPGRGIAQWSVGGRWDSSHNDNVTAFANQHGGSRWDLQTQLDFTWYELTTFPSYGLASLQSASSLSAAVVVFQNKFEACGACNQARRISSAQHVLSTYGGQTPTPTPDPGTGSDTGSGTDPGTGSDPGTPTPTPTGGAQCYSGTLGAEVDDNTCVQSKYDSAWYQCENGSWVDRWTDPNACSSVHPL